MKLHKLLLSALLIGMSTAAFSQAPTNPTNNTSTPPGGQNAGQNFNQQMVPSSSGAVGSSGFTGSNSNSGSPNSTGSTGIGSGGAVGYTGPGSGNSNQSVPNTATPNNTYPMPQAPR